MVTRARIRARGRPFAAALFALGLALPWAGGAAAQQVPYAPPDRFETARLVWTTLIAVDHANRTGNYSVLRDLGAPDFQRLNDAARLAGIFAGIRERDIGLGRVVLSAPVYAEPPAVLANGMYRVTGAFPGRPAGVAFDLLFQNVEGRWLLYGVSVGEAPAEPPPVGGGPPKPQARPEAPAD